MAIFWSNVGVDVQTSLATAVTITGITKANPGVVTATAHGLANGDYVLLSSQGMHQLNNKIFRVANKTDNTFELEGENTTSYDTFTSGTATAITFGASMTTAQDINVSGGEPEYADTTTIHDSIKQRAPVVTSPMTMTMNNIFKPSDTALIELRSATKTLTTRAIKLRFSDGSKIVGNAYVSAPGVPTGSAQQVVQTPVSLEFQGMPTVYAS